MTAQEYIIESEKLFDEWKEKQRQEPDEKYNEYKFGNVDKTSFLPDGIIDPNKYFSAAKKVLFIAKEANWGGSDNESNINSQEDEFWLKDVVNKKYNPTLFSNGLSMLYNAYTNNSFDTPDYSHEGLKNVAFINLNKRGGYSFCSFPTLIGYVENYGEYIAEQIDLINPDIIICCGAALVNIIKKFAKPKQCKAPIIGVYHPSYYGISKDVHLKMLECALNGKTMEKPAKATNISIPEPERGIIFDTNLSYSNTAVEEMIGGAKPKISAFGAAKKNIDLLKIGDIIFYYHKGCGIIAVAKVVGEVEEDLYFDEKFRKVEMICSPVRNENNFLGVAVNNDFRKTVKKENTTKGFWLHGTRKTPYLYNNKKTENDEIKRAIELVQQKLQSKQILLKSYTATSKTP